MKIEAKTYDVGVITGRFQVHELHEGHRDLIQYVVDNHAKVIITLGIAPIPCSTGNPLDFQMRRQMIHEQFPGVEVVYVRDMPTDEAWSKQLDSVIESLVSPGQSVVLYGSRDSFISHYSGKNPTCALEAEKVMSGTAVRNWVKKSASRASEDFRAGVIWATGARYPTAFTTVDIAILDREKGAILLGKKEGESLYRFVGGFSDPKSETFEDDARREVAEETGLSVGDMRYVGSARVDDWRYRGEPDCIKTMLFAAEYIYGHPKADDDLAEVRWFPLKDGADYVALYPQIMAAHRPLLNLLEATS